MPDLRETAQRIVEHIEIFDKQCAETQYTDTGMVWELLDAFRADLKLALAEGPRGQRVRRRLKKDVAN